MGPELAQLKPYAVSFHFHNSVDDHIYHHLTILRTGIFRTCVRLPVIVGCIYIVGTSGISCAFMGFNRDPMGIV